MNGMPAWKSVAWGVFFGLLPITILWFVLQLAVYEIVKHDIRNTARRTIEVMQSNANRTE